MITSCMIISESLELRAWSEMEKKKNLLVNIRRESDHSTSMSREKCYFSLECSRCDPVWEKVAVIAEMDTNPNAKNNEKQ